MASRELSVVEWIGENPPPPTGIIFNNIRYTFEPIRFLGGRRVAFPVKGSSELMAKFIGRQNARIVDLLDPAVQEAIFYETLAREAETIRKMFGLPDDTPMPTLVQPRSEEHEETEGVDSSSDKTPMDGQPVSQVAQEGKGKGKKA